MAKGLHLLTTKEVEAAKPRTTLRDGGGLTLRVAAGGGGRWSYRFKPRAQPQREMGLGAFPAVSLAAARRKAAWARDLVAQDKDPIAETEKAVREASSAAQAMTFGQYADEVFLPYVLPQFSNGAHIQQWRATFTADAACLRDKLLADIHREDVLEVLRPIWTVKPVTANRSRGRLERLFAHATQNGAFRGDNPAAWRQFDATLPAPRKLTRGHHASIPHDDIAPIIAALRPRQKESMSALMLEFIALSACRTGEARFAVWSEIDMERGVWTIPAERMKMRRGHSVPITPRMAEILRQTLTWRMTDPSPGDHLFTTPRAGKPLSEMACLMLLQRMTDGDYTVHGLRATFKSWAATCTEFPRELIEEQLAHQLGAVERAYMRGNAVERRRIMMEAWESHLSGKTTEQEAGNVLNLKRTGGQV